MNSPRVMKNSSGVQESCLNLFSDLSTFFENSDILYSMFRLSGKEYNDFGRFKDCVKDERFQYLLVTCKEEKCGDKFPIPVSVGWCIPKECSKDDINKLLPYLMPIVDDDILPYEFSPIPGLQNVQLSIQELSLADSVDLNNESVKFKFGNFFVVFLLIALLILVIFSTIATQMSKRSKNNEEANPDQN